MPRPRGLKHTDSTTNRPKQLILRLTQDEDDIIYDAARRHGMSAQLWVRTRLLAVAEIEKHKSEFSLLLEELVEKMEDAEAWLSSQK